MSDSLELARKLGHWLVTFSLQDGLSTVYRFTTATSDQTDLSGNTYTSLPSMAIELPESTGALESRPARITVPTSAHSLFTRLGEGTAFVPVIVRIAEHVEAFAADYQAVVPAATEVTHLKGRLDQVVLNAGGRSGILRIEVVPQKGRLNVPLGIPATPQCQWTFRKGGCGAEAAAAAEEQLVTVASIAGLVLTIDSLGGVPGVGGDIFRRGTIRNATDGVEIGIRSWSYSGAPTVFYMMEVPPSSWVGQTVRLKPGCRGSLTECQAWGQEENFLGLGIKLPNYHPVPEVPD